MKRSWSKTLLLVPLAVLLIGVALHRPVGAKTQRCPPRCDVKLEKGPWVYSGDKVVVAVCVKAGTKVFFFRENGGNGCYTVAGLGTNNVVVLGGGTGPACKDISHVCFYFQVDGDDGGGIG